MLCRIHRRRWLADTRPVIVLGIQQRASRLGQCASAMAAYEASADTLSSDMATLDAKISVQDGDLEDLDSAITTLDRLVDQLQQAAAKTGSGSGTGSGRPR